MTQNITAILKSSCEGYSYLIDFTVATCLAFLETKNIYIFNVHKKPKTSDESAEIDHKIRSGIFLPKAHSKKETSLLGSSYLLWV